MPYYLTGLVSALKSLSVLYNIKLQLHVSISREEKRFQTQSDDRCKNLGYLSVPDKGLLINNIKHNLGQFKHYT